MHIDIVSGILTIFISIMPSLFSSPFAIPKTYTQGEANGESTIMEPEYESYNTAVSTVDVVKQLAVSMCRKSAY